MEIKETIDIIMPTYNGEKFLKEQIDSLLNQTYRNIRILISDDSSKDRTPEILKQYEKKDTRVEVFLQKENLGVVKNIEFLLKKVKNPYYMLSDQDDVWLQEKVEKSLEALEKNKADMVFGDLEVVDEKLNTIYPSFNEFMGLNRKIKKYSKKYQINYLYNCVTGCTILAKKETINYILPIPTESKYCIHDHWMGIMVAINGTLAYMPEKYIKYRQHGGNVVGTEKISHKFEHLEQVRNLFLQVKIGVFRTYQKNKERFPKNIQELNAKAYKYFNNLEKKKNFNFKGWGIFHQLYKTEKLMYYIENFIIMNMPFIGKGLFKIRLIVLKLIRKR